MIPAVIIVLAVSGLIVVLIGIADVEHPGVAIEDDDARDAPAASDQPGASGRSGERLPRSPHTWRSWKDTRVEDLYQARRRWSLDVTETTLLGVVCALVFGYLIVHS